MSEPISAREEVLNDPRMKPFLAEAKAKLAASKVTAYEVVTPSEVSATVQPVATGNSDDVEAKGRRSQATELVELADEVTLFHTPEQTAYGVVTIDGRQETWALRTKGFRGWLARNYYQKHRRAPGSQAVQDALGVLEGKALYEGQTKPVFTRVGLDGEDIIIDLGDSDWSAVRVAKSGWEVLPVSPVHFRRSPGMKPIPAPVGGGDIDDLFRFMNVRAEDRIVLKASLVQALNPRGPYPINVFHGADGAGKSSNAKWMRGLIDPNTAALRADPKTNHDLYIAAKNSWVVALDNLSSVNRSLSDALSRLSTGGGFSTRTLYTDSEEELIDVQRPIIITAIGDVLTSGDALSRAILFHCEPIPESDRRPESEIQADFERCRPLIFGALLDALSCALKEKDNVRLTRLPRMADFAVFAAAASSAVGFTPDDFIDAYDANRKAASQVALEADAIAEIVERFMEDREEWQGKASELLSLLNDQAEDDVRRQREWPKAAHVLSNKLERISHNLQTKGIYFHRGRTAQSRTIVLSKNKPQSLLSLASHTSPDAVTHDDADAYDDQNPNSSNGCGHNPDEICDQCHFDELEAASV